MAKEYKLFKLKISKFIIFLFLFNQEEDRILSKLEEKVHLIHMVWLLQMYKFNLLKMYKDIQIMIYQVNNGEYKKINILKIVISKFHQLQKVMHS